MKLDELRARLIQEEQQTQAEKMASASSHLGQLIARLKTAFGEVIHTVTLIVGDAKPFSTHIDGVLKEIFRQRLIDTAMSDESLASSCAQCRKASPNSALCPDCVFAVASSIVGKGAVCEGCRRTSDDDGAPIRLCATFSTHGAPHMVLCGDCAGLHKRPFVGSKP